jgi:hypothetical protein
MADYRIHLITWKNVIDYNGLQLQITWATKHIITSPLYEGFEWFVDRF